MKRFYFLFFWLMVLMIFSFSCKKENAGDCFKSTGDITSEYRTVAAFDTIEAFDNVNVYFQQDSFFEVRVEAGENLLPLIKTEVVNNKLMIHNKNTCNWVRSFKKQINVYVTSPSVGAVYSEGTGNMKSTNNIHGNLLIIKMANSGDVDMETNFTNIKCNISASNGNLYLKGNAEIFEVFCVGTTIVQASDLHTVYSFIQTWGTGDMHLNVEHEIGAQIYWVGNVYYHGNPPVVNEAYTNSGRLIPG